MAEHECDDERDNWRHPMRVVRHELVGWTMERLRQRNDEEYPTAEEAMEAAQKCCPYLLEWWVRATDPDGHNFYYGAHPQTIAFEKNHAHSFDFQRFLKERAADEEALVRAVGEEAARTSYYVEPIFRRIYEPNRDAYYVAPGSHVIVSPDYGGWQVTGAGPRLFAETREEAFALGLERHHRVMADEAKQKARELRGRTSWFSRLLGR